MRRTSRQPRTRPASDRNRYGQQAGRRLVHATARPAVRLLPGPIRLSTATGSDKRATKAEMEILAKPRAPGERCPKPTYMYFGAEDAPLPVRKICSCVYAQNRRSWALPLYLGNVISGVVMKQPTSFCQLPNIPQLVHGTTHRSHSSFYDVLKRTKNTGTVTKTLLSRRHLAVMRIFIHRTMVALYRTERSIINKKIYIFRGISIGEDTRSTLLPLLLQAALSSVPIMCVYYVGYMISGFYHTTKHYQY